MCICQIFNFFHYSEKKNDYSAQDFGQSIIKTLPYRTALFTGSFATFSVLSYLIYSENYRQDIDLFYTGFMGNKSYLKNIKSNYPYYKFGEDISSLEFDPTFLSIFEQTGRKVFLELSIDKNDSKYGIRYDDIVINALSVDGWFFSFSDNDQNILKENYYSFWKNNMFSKYNNGGYELRKNILLGIFLHAKYFYIKKDYEGALFLVKNGLMLNSDFEPFRKIKRDIEHLN